MDEDKVIDVPPIVPDFESFFGESVERMEVQIGKNLRCKIANRETDSGWCIKKTLVSRESLPIGSTSFDRAVYGRIVGYDHTDEKAERLGIRSLVLGVDNIFDLSKENRSVDGHEKSGNIELQYPCGVLIVIG